MKKITSWLLGISLGAAFGAVIIALFVPTPAKEVVRRLREGYQQALDEARQASLQRRAELEAELAVLQNSNAAIQPSDDARK
jgi:gas vesicle protein